MQKGVESIPKSPMDTRWMAADGRSVRTGEVDSRCYSVTDSIAVHTSTGAATGPAQKSQRLKERKVLFESGQKCQAVAMGGSELNPSRVPYTSACNWLKSLIWSRIC
jgi:hypothetical protein